jgi:hypothetical protein
MKKKEILIYLGAILSSIATVFYFLPSWLDPNTTLGFYILGAIWMFLAGWMILLTNLILIGILIKNKNSSWKHLAISSGIIIICYLILFIGMSKGYIPNI